MKKKLLFSVTVVTMLFSAAVFVKTYNENEALLENLEALTQMIEGPFIENGTTYTKREPYTYDIWEYKYLTDNGGGESDWICGQPQCMNIYSNHRMTKMRHLVGVDCSKSGQETCTQETRVDTYDYNPM